MDTTMYCWSSKTLVVTDGLAGALDGWIMEPADGHEYLVWPLDYPGYVTQSIKEQYEIWYTE